MRLKESLLFLRQGIADRNVGALLPTMPWAAGRILRDINASVRRIVEYGPGTGALTRRLLEKFPRSRVIAIECNPYFAEILRTIENERLTVREGTALNVRAILQDMRMEETDVVVSGIPFSALRPHDARTLVEDTFASLADEGHFLVYQWRCVAHRHLREVFPSVRTFRCRWNFPPLIVFDAQKNGKFRADASCPEHRGGTGRTP